MASRRPRGHRSPRSSRAAAGRAPSHRARRCSSAACSGDRRVARTQLDGQAGPHLRLIRNGTSLSRLNPKILLATLKTLFASPNGNSLPCAREGQADRLEFLGSYAAHANLFEPVAGSLACRKSILARLSKKSVLTHTEMRSRRPTLSQNRPNSTELWATFVSSWRGPVILRRLVGGMDVDRITGHVAAVQSARVERGGRPAIFSQTAIFMELSSPKTSRPSVAD